VTQKELITIGIPVLNEEDNIPELISRLTIIVDELSDLGLRIEILVNNNASTDASANLLDKWSDSDDRVKVNHIPFLISFQASILELLRASHGDAFILLQSDLQDPPETIKTFTEFWLLGDKVIAGVITERDEGRFTSLIRKLFYLMLKMFADGNIIIGFQDFYLIDRSVVNSLKNLAHDGLFLRGHISSRFGSVRKVAYSRQSRKRGITKFSFPAKYSLALDGLLLFGTRFVRSVSTISFIMFSVGIIGTFCTLVLFLTGFMPSLGSITLGIMLFTLLSLLGVATGLILEFLIRIYRFLIFSTNHK
jgi:glycosyltransferase involved in cell wall biosynthesis